MKDLHRLIQQYPNSSTAVIALLYALGMFTLGERAFAIEKKEGESKLMKQSVNALTVLSFLILAVFGLWLAKKEVSHLIERRNQRAVKDA